jgi:hypothetical protein
MKIYVYTIKQLQLTTKQSKGNSEDVGLKHDNTRDSFTFFNMIKMDVNVSVTILCIYH